MWDHDPEPAELVAARLAHGWKPTPSPLRDGDRVLGHGACSVVRPDA